MLHVSHLLFSHTSHVTRMLTIHPINNQFSPIQSSPISIITNQSPQTKYCRRLRAPDYTFPIEQNRPLVPLKTLDFLLLEIWQKHGVRASSRRGFLLF